MSVRISVNVALFFLFLCSCQKEGTDNDDDLYYFRYSYKVDEREYCVVQGKPGRGWGNGYYNSGAEFGNVCFSSLEYTEGTEFPKLILKDDSVTMFSFFYGSYYGWRWFVNSEYIINGEKNYFDVSHDFLLARQYEYCAPQLWDFSACAIYPIVYSPIIHGWMSFDKVTDNSDIILRVEYEAVSESPYPRFGEKWERDSTYTYLISEGRIDFTTKMAGRIKGLNRIIVGEK